MMTPPWRELIELLCELAGGESLVCRVSCELVHTISFQTSPTSCDGPCLHRARHLVRSRRELQPHLARHTVSPSTQCFVCRGDGDGGAMVQLSWSRGRPGEGEAASNLLSEEEHDPGSTHIYTIWRKQCWAGTLPIWSSIMLQDVMIHCTSIHVH